MGFFDTAKPTVDKKELKKVINELYSSGNFSSRERAMVEISLKPHLDPSAANRKSGIDHDEVMQVIGGLRKPDAAHMKVFGSTIPEAKIKFLEDSLSRHLKD